MAPKGKGGKSGKGGKGGKSGKGKPGNRQETNAATASSSTPAAGRDFPSEVIFSILSRLPAKSVLRFKCASKQWRTISNLPAFASAHLARSTAGLLIHAPNDLPPVAGGEIPAPPAGGEHLPDYPNGYGLFTYAPPSTDIQRVHFPGYDGVSQLDVVGTTDNGLVCIVQQHLARSFMIWNPATRSTLRIPVPKLPRPSELLGATAGFAFDTASPNDYTIIRIVRFHEEHLPDVVQLYSFQTGRWGRLVNDLSGGIPFRTIADTCEVVVEGVPYWRAMENEEGFGAVMKLVWFDPKSKEFHSAMFRWRIWSDTGMILGEYRPGYLGALVWERPEGVWEDRALDIWTWEQVFGNGTWVKAYRIELGVLPIVGRVVGFFGEGELVQEIVGGTPEEPKLCLCVTKFNDTVNVRDVCVMDGAWPGTFKVSSYRPSLTRLPRVRGSLI